MEHKTNCSHCGDVITRKRRIKKDINFCNASCQMKYEYANGIRDRKTATKKAVQKIKEIGQPHLKGRTGELNNNWKGGRSITTHGYVQIRKFGGYILEHRYIWEKANGEIPNGFQIHHIDGNRQNNKLENLQMLSNSEHQKLHNQNKNLDDGRFIRDKQEVEGFEE